ncbi:MAG: hypothetical protein ACYTF0_03220 [Planctomycetota bacterium]|jgi:hypothetical protein
MSVSWQIDDPNRVVWVTVSGTLGINEHQRFINYLLGQYDDLSGFVEVVDLRAVDSLELNTTEIAQVMIGEAAKMRAKGLKGIIFVVANALVKAVAEVFSHIGTALGVPSVVIDHEQDSHGVIESLRSNQPPT